ncbi:MAG TPA: tetratricopeptide repeat protein [Terriglobia bacterium]|nr:tetratricopeptide repeat protein [Terriglobia bacterium]
MKLLQEKQYADALEQFQLVERGAPQSPQGPSGEGIALALMGKPREAIEALKRALALDPTFWVAQRELGIVYWSQNLKEEAVRELEPVITLHPDDGPVDVILGQYKFEHADYEQALTYLSRVPGQVGADPHLSLIAAEAQLETGQTAEASTTLKRLVGRTGLTNEHSFKLAWLLGQAKLFKPAIEVFRQLPPAYPDEFRRNYGMALAYFGDEQYDRCIATLNALRAHGNMRPELFALLGVAEEKSGHTKEAYDAFEQGILTNPADAQNYLNIATLACEHLNYDLAAEILTSGIKRIPNSHELFLSRGIAYTLKAQFALAQGDYNRAIELAPSDAGSYLAMGLSQLEAGDLDGAVRSFERSSERDSKDALAYYFVAEALIQKGVSPGTATFGQAEQATDAAISLDSGFAYAYRDRAKLELQAKETDRAIADLERARAADPKSSSIAYLLGQAYQQKGRDSEAKELFAQVGEAAEREAREFRRDSLTQTLVVISKSGH